MPNNQLKRNFKPIPKGYSSNLLMFTSLKPFLSVVAIEGMISLIYLFIDVTLERIWVEIFLIQLGIMIMGFLIHYIWINIKLSNFMSKAYDLYELQPTGHSFYFSYDKILVENLTGILNSYNNLYKFIYYVCITDEFKESKLDSYIEVVNKDLLLHPKSNIEFSSLHTGGSIVWKSKTGWVPKIYLEDGKPVVETPNGLVVFIFLGFILTNIIEGGNEVYEFNRGPLEQEKLNLEIKKLKLENEKLGLEVELLKDKFDDLPDKGFRDEFKKRIDNLRFEMSKDNIQTAKFYNKPLKFE